MPPQKRIGRSEELIDHHHQQPQKSGAAYLANDKKRLSNSHAGMTDRRVDGQNTRNHPVYGRREAHKEPPPGKGPRSRPGGDGPPPRMRSEGPRGPPPPQPGSPRQAAGSKDGSARGSSSYYSADRRKSGSARPRQLPQPGEAPRRNSAAAADRAGYPAVREGGGGGGSGRSPGRAPSDAVNAGDMRNHIRKDASPGRACVGVGAALGDLSPSRRSDDGDEYRTPPDRSPNLSRQHQDFPKGVSGYASDRSPSYYPADKSPNREDVYRTPPDRSPNRSSAYHRSPVMDGGPRSAREREGHRREGSGGGDGHHPAQRRKDSSPGRGGAGPGVGIGVSVGAPAPTTGPGGDTSAMTLHPHDQPTSNPNYPATSQAGRRRSSSGQRLERQTAVVRERVEMHPDDIPLGSDTQLAGTVTLSILLLCKSIYTLIQKSVPSQYSQYCFSSTGLVMFHFVSSLFKWYFRTNKARFIFTFSPT